MKSKNQLNLFTLLLIVCTSISLTASGQEKDSVKYSISESKAVVDAYLNLPKYIKLVDSCEKQIIEYKGIIKNDSIVFASNEREDKTQTELIESYKKKDDIATKDLKFANFWRRFWKTTSAVLTVPASITIYNLVKRE